MFKLEESTVVITGANSGIGFEIARTLAKRKACVIFACKNQFWGEYAVNKVKLDTGNTNIFYKNLDLSSIDSIHNFSNKFNLDFENLNVLINNPTIKCDSFSKTVDGFEMNMGVNHLGHFALTGLLLDKILKTPNSRIITISSLFYRFGKIDFDNMNDKKNFKSNKAYNNSRLANMLFSLELARKLKKHNIYTSSVSTHPGWTKISRSSNKFIRLFASIFGQSTELGALPTLHAVSLENVKNGDYFFPNKFGIYGKPQKKNILETASNLKISRQLWNLSEDLTQIIYKF